MGTCTRWQIEDKYGQDTGKDAGHDDVNDVEQRLPLNDQVEGDVLIQVIVDVLSAGLVTNLPLTVLLGKRED